MKTSKPGFTLIELLLVIGIIAILAAIVIVAINPTKQLADARNAQRRSDVNTLLNAFWQYAIDSEGDFQPTPAVTACAITGTPKQICADIASNAAAGANSCGALGCVYSSHLVATYLVDIPTDPSEAASTNVTNYYVSSLASGRLTVSAAGAELAQAGRITVSR